MKLERTNRSTYLIRRISRALSGISVLACLCLMSLLTASQVKPQGSQATRGMMFPTAQAAAEALISASERFDEAGLMQILGPNSYDIIHSGEPVVDKEIAQEFASLARKKMSIVPDKRFRNRAFISIGEDDWPFPIPLIKVGREWYFDAAAGRQEILFETPTEDRWEAGFRAEGIDPRLLDSGAGAA